MREEIFKVCFSGDMGGGEFEANPRRLKSGFAISPPEGIRIVKYKGSSDTHNDIQIAQEVNSFIDKWNK